MAKVNLTTRIDNKGIFKTKEQLEKNIEEKPGKKSGPKLYGFLTSPSYKEEYWTDNNCEIPNIKTWEDLRFFLRNERISLAAKLEFIYNLDSNAYCSWGEPGKPIPDEFWQDVTLDRKIRGLCRIKSVTFEELKHKKNDGNAIDIYYQQFVKDLDDELFLGMCELQIIEYVLLESSKLTLEQKELVVKSAANFQKSYNKQDDSKFEHLLLKALDLNIFSPKLMNEMYQRAKNNMLTTGKYGHLIFPRFINSFYSDITISKDDKLRVLNNSIPDNRDYNFSKSHIFYIGNNYMPAFIQERMIDKLINTHKKVFDETYEQTFKNLNPTSYIAVLKNPDIDYDIKLKFINVTINPVMLSLAIVDEEVDDNIAALAKVKLETMKIAETKEFLEILKTLINNSNVYIRRMI